MTVQEKVCTRCDSEQSIDQFRTRTGKEHLTHSWCRTCEIAAAKPRKRDWYLRQTYGITSAEYAERLAAQGGGCAVCGVTEHEFGSLHVDHDHATGEVRGILCVRCNHMVGLAKDSVSTLVSAAAYLIQSGG